MAFGDVLDLMHAERRALKSSNSGDWPAERGGLMCHVVRYGSSYAEQAVGEPAVVVLGVPEVSEREKDQKSHEHSHLTSP